MDAAERQHRRFFTLLVIFVVYLVSSFLQSFVLDQIEEASKIIIEPAKDFVDNSDQLQSSAEQVNLEEAADEVQNSLDRRRKISIKTNDGSDTSLYFDLWSCFPRFICEVHARGPISGGGGEASLTALESDVLSLFSRGYTYLQGPSSPIYTFQLAAHLGQLAAGFIPSPCHNIYPNCPLSRVQLLELLTDARSGRKTIH